MYRFSLQGRTWGVGRSINDTPAYIARVIHYMALCGSGVWGRLGSAARGSNRDVVQWQYLQKWVFIYQLDVHLVRHLAGPFGELGPKIMGGIEKELIVSPVKHINFLPMDYVSRAV